MARRTYDETRRWLSLYKRLTGAPGAVGQTGSPGAAMVGQTRVNPMDAAVRRSDRNRQTVANARVRGDAVMRGARSGAISYFDQYSGDPRVAAETKARLDASRRWYAGERYTPSTLAGPRDERGRTLIGGDGGFSYRRANEARARGAGVASVTFGEGDGFTTTSMGDALATARRIGSNNQRRGRLIEALAGMGASQKDLSELYRTHKGLQGAAIGDVERDQVSKFLQAARKRATDEFWSARRGIQSQRDELAKTGLMTRTDVVARLLGDRRKLRGLSSPYRPDGSLDTDLYGSMVAAAGGLASTVGYGAGLRGRRTSGTGSAAMGFTATDRATADGITSSGRLSARFTGGGSGYLSALGGGSGSSANNPAVAFRSMLKTAIGEDPGGRISGYTPQGDPIFTADRRGGYDHKSFEQKQYERAALEYRRDADKMLSDSISSGGAGAQWIIDQRVMKALARADRVNASRYVRTLDAMTEAARLAGLRPGDFGFQSAPELPKSPASERMEPDAPTVVNVSRPKKTDYEYVEEERPVG